MAWIYSHKTPESHPCQLETCDQETQAAFYHQESATLYMACHVDHASLARIQDQGREIGALAEEMKNDSI